MVAFSMFENRYITVPESKVLVFSLLKLNFDTLGVAAGRLEKWRVNMRGFEMVGLMPQNHIHNSNTCSTHTLNHIYDSWQPCH